MPLLSGLFCCSLGVHNTQALLCSLHIQALRGYDVMWSKNLSFTDANVTICIAFTISNLLRFPVALLLKILMHFAAILATNKY